MRVLAKGRPQKGWAEKYSCTGQGNGGGGCGAKLLVERNDVFRTSSSHYDGSTEYYCTFMCPECHVWTDIRSCPFTPREMTDEEEAERVRRDR